MITKSAESKTNFALNLIFTDSARSAWGHVLAGVAMTKSPVVLMPAYIGYTEREGSGVFDPVTENSAEYQFYKVDETLKIDIEDFTNAIKTGSVNVALVIHYFGFCQNNMVEIKELCNKHNVLLVEDCAHAFQLDVNNQRIGNYGDFSFYSLHKYLATSAGGVLRINSNTIQLPQLPRYKHIATADLEQYAKTQFNEVARARRNNYLSYAKFLPKSDKIKVMFDLQEVDIPQSFPIRVKNSLREELYFYLIEKHMPVTALYYRLIDQLSIEKFPISFLISHEIMNLPVHQDVDDQDIKTICKSILDFLNTKA